MPTDPAPSVLIVDDNPDNLRVLEGILRPEGYKVRPALGGKIALAAATRIPPDAILLDIRMPDMDGYEVCRKLRELPETKDVPVLFISALQDISDKSLAFQAGGVDYLTKPFQPEEVLARTRTHLELARARAALARSNEALEELVQQRTQELRESLVQLELTMGEERCLRQLLALSHQGQPLGDYLEAALDILHRYPAWQATYQGSAVFLSRGEDGKRFDLVATCRLSTPADTDGYSLPIEGFADKVKAGPLGIAADASVTCTSLTLGDRVAGMLVTVNHSDQAKPPADLLQNVANILAMAIVRRHDEDRIRLLLDSTSEGIVGIDRDGLCIFINRAALELLGIDAARDILGQPVRTFIQPLNDTGMPVPDNEGCLERTVGLGEGFHVDDRCFQRRNGDLLPVEYWSYPIREGERTTGAVVAFADVAERRKAQAALHELNTQLEKRVEEEVARNREKDHLLIQQSRLAAMGEMVHNIAHQWRQPLNALAITQANLRDAYDFGDLDREFMEETTRSSERIIQSMSRTIDDFRDFFRPDKEKSVFSLKTSIHDALSITEAALEHHSIQVELKGDAEISAWGYPNEFAQVILNLVGNARDAILAHPPTSGKSAIKIAVDEDEEQALVTLQDNGGGIPADVLPKIFDPYFTTKENGTGIGLYMSKVIIEQNMGGKLSITNHDGGVLVIIRCPRQAPRSQAGA